MLIPWRVYLVPVLFCTVLQLALLQPGKHAKMFMISQAELRLGKVKLDQLPIDLSNTYASGLEDPGNSRGKGWKRAGCLYLDKNNCSNDGV